MFETIVNAIFVGYILLLHIAFLRLLFYCADLYSELDDLYKCKNCGAKMLKEANNE